MKIVAIMWQSYLNMFIHACRDLAHLMEVKAYSSKKLEEEPERIDRVLEEAAKADLVFLYRANEAFWESVEDRFKELGKKIPIVCAGYDPTSWALSTVKPEVPAKVMAYIGINGKTNFTNMIRYVAREAGGMDLEVAEPEPLIWQGVYHPEAAEVFPTVEAYMEWYGPWSSQRRKSDAAGMVGIHFHRHHWVNEDMDVEDALICELENLGLDVLPVFSNSFKDDNLGCLGGAKVIQDFFPGQGPILPHRRPHPAAILPVVQH